MKQTTPTTIRESGGRKLFRVINTLLLAFICLIFIIPIWNVLITSVAKDIDVPVRSRCRTTGACSTAATWEPSRTRCS